LRPLADSPFVEMTDLSRDVRRKARGGGGGARDRRADRAGSTRVRERSADRAGGLRAAGAGRGCDGATRRLLAALEELAEVGADAWRDGRHRDVPAWRDLQRARRDGADVRRPEVAQQVLRLSCRGDAEEYMGTNARACPVILALQGALGLSDADLHTDGRLLDALRRLRGAALPASAWRAGGEHEELDAWRDLGRAAGSYSCDTSNADVLDEVLAIGRDCGEVYEDDLGRCPCIRALSDRIRASPSRLGARAMVGALRTLADEARRSGTTFELGDEEGLDAWATLRRLRLYCRERDVLREMRAVSERMGERYDGTNADECLAIVAFQNEFGLEDGDMHPTGALLAALRQEIQTAGASAEGEGEEEEGTEFRGAVTLATYFDITNAIDEGADASHPEVQLCVTELARCLSGGCEEEEPEERAGHVLRQLCADLRIPLPAYGAGADAAEAAAERDRAPRLAHAA